MAGAGDARSGDSARRWIGDRDGDSEHTGGSTTVRVYVTVSSGAAAGTVDMTTVTATSLGDSAVSAFVTDATTAQAWPYSIYLPLALKNQ